MAVQGTAVANEKEVITVTIGDSANAESLVAESQKLPKSLEQLQQENEELKRKLSRIPERLEDKISFFEQKKGYINQLTKLEKSKLALETTHGDVMESMEEDEFFSETFSFRVSRKTGYSSHEEDVFKMNNPTIVGEVIDFVLDRITAKMGDLRKAIDA